MANDLSNYFNMLTKVSVAASAKQPVHVINCCQQITAAAAITANYILHLFNQPSCVQISRIGWFSIRFLKQLFYKYDDFSVTYTPAS